jgi:hypothetical protein
MTIATKGPAGIIKHLSLLSFAEAVSPDRAAYCNCNSKKITSPSATFIGMDLETVQHLARVQYAVALDPRDLQPLIDNAVECAVMRASFNAREMIALC